MGEQVYDVAQIENIYERLCLYFSLGRSLSFLRKNQIQGIFTTLPNHLGASLSENNASC